MDRKRSQPDYGFALPHSSRSSSRLRSGPFSGESLPYLDPIYNAVYGSLKKSLIHTSTYSENGLVMRVRLAVLDTLQKENPGPRAQEMGDYLCSQPRAQLAEFEIAAEIRGAGLFSGVAFKAPRKLTLRTSYEAFMPIHPAMFGQVLVMPLFNDHGILTQICGNNFKVLKVAPPLVVARAQIDNAWRPSEP
jgi:ornithine--oxo-acid transaminase